MLVQGLLLEILGVRYSLFSSKISWWSRAKKRVRALRISLEHLDLPVSETLRL